MTARFEAARDAVALLTNRTYAGAAEALKGLPEEVYQLVIDLQAEARSACERILAEAHKPQIPRATADEAAENSAGETNGNGEATMSEGAGVDVPPVDQKHPPRTETDVADAPPPRRKR